MLNVPEQRPAHDRPTAGTAIQTTRSLPPSLAKVKADAIVYGHFGGVYFSQILPARTVETA